MSDNWSYRHVVFSPQLFEQIFGDKIVYIEANEEDYENEPEPQQLPDLNFLSGKQQEVINFYLMGMNFTQIGHAIGISKQAAVKRFHRAIKTCKKHLVEKN